MKMTTRETQQKAIALFRQHGGTLRTAEALRLGIHPRTLYAMRDAGVLVRLSRGLYRLAEFPPLSNPDLVTVALNIPQAVICLVSALAFHELTTQVPLGGVHSSPPPGTCARHPARSHSGHCRVS